MAYKRKLPFECSVEELDRELIARGAQIPVENPFEFRDREGSPEREAIMAQAKELYYTAPLPNKALSHISTWELVETLMSKTKKKRVRGIWRADGRMDFYELTNNKQIKKNARSTAAICMKDSLIDTEKRFSTLKIKNYGETFNLCESEPFRNQPIAAGRLCTGFLVKEDVIATAGHCADEKNLTDLRIVFGFKMLGLSTPVTWIPNENIYKGLQIIHRIYDPKGSGSDWALIKLDRKVVGHLVVNLSKKPIYLTQPVYILGHPCGLPLKYASGAQVRDITDTCFAADLNVYCGNSGSPVFDSKTHEVIGIVVRGDTQDFRWTGKGWLSIIYPNPDIHSKEPQCTRVSEFKNIVDMLP
jgi:hypothetical protein